MEERSQVWKEIVVILKLLKIVSVTGILFLSMVVAQAQNSTAVPSSSKFAPSEPGPAPPGVEASNKEEPKPSERERALLDRIEQLEKKLVEIEGLVKKPAAESATAAAAKTPAQTDLVSASTPAIAPTEKPVQAEP